MKADWNKFGRGIFLINVLAIIYNPTTKKILIGRRKNDPYIKELTWCFPGGRPDYKKDIEACLKEIVKRETNLVIDIKKVIFAKTYTKRRDFLSIYYYAECKGGKEKPEEDLKELKWVKPIEVKKYFDKSLPTLHPKLVAYLKKLK